MRAQAPDDVTVRWAESGDRAAIAGLLQLTKRHYGEEPEPIADIEAAVAEWLEAKPGHALFVIACAGGVPARLGWLEMYLPLAGTVNFPAWLARLLAAPVHFIMQKRQLRDIKRRAETARASARHQDEINARS